jgi:mono/diheme cytochrome c family protein
MNRFLVKIGLLAFPIVATLLLSSAPVLAQNDAASLFKGKCAACHGADGSGNTTVGKSMKIRDFHSPDVQKQTDPQLTDMITNGKGAMPSYKGKLTDDQIKELVGYVRELTKK